MNVDRMLRLSTSATFHSNGDGNLWKVTYKSGASFAGLIQDYKKTGSGTFAWPDGSIYEGDYVDNCRHGHGLQLWADGMQYVGCFVKDLRHGEGVMKWDSGETYEGTFFKDRRHGKGKYVWSDGSSYTGFFYMDKKEGYGTFCFADGKRFEGLYKTDEREGPGIFTYLDGHQDVGFWHGECLIKLVTEVANTFTMKDHTEFEYQLQDMSILIDPVTDNICHVKDILQPPALFDYSPQVKVDQIKTNLYVENLDPHCLAVDHQTFDMEFFKDLLTFKDPGPEVLVVWNKTPVLTDLQIHIHKHQLAANTVSFPVHQILQFDRSSFKERGLLEVSSEELIKMAASGNIKRVEELLTSGTVHPDVSDRYGFTALVAATINWHQDTINILLNGGANVNQLTDEGLSALAAGMIFYYPIESFQKNIAEKYVTAVASQELSRSNKTCHVAGSRSEPEVSQPNHLSQCQLETAELNISDGASGCRTKGGKATSKKSQKDSASELTLIKKEQRENYKREETKGCNNESAFGEEEKDVETDEFESNVSVHNFQIEVTDYLVERCATQLSLNEHVVSQESTTLQTGKARKLAIQMSQRQRMKETLELLLKRGADPNVSHVPMPVLFFAIKAADVDMVQTLLLKGATTQICLEKDKGGLAPLHIASAIPGEEGVAITELLLHALADPDVRAAQDELFFSRTLEEGWSKDAVPEECKALLGGCTPLHIACARDDSYKNACQVVHLLLKHRANPNLLCDGFSPLALAIHSGNDLAIDELLLHGADPSLPLTHGVGNALCVATSTEYEHRRTIQGRIQLIDKLIKAGGDILAPVLIGPKRSMGTAVDFAYYMFNQDRRIAHMPYHALTHSERETYNARRKLLAHIGDILRDKAVDREKKRLADEENKGFRSASPSANFVYVGSGASLPPGYKSRAGQVTFEQTPVADKDDRLNNRELPVMNRRKPLFKYCYDCGRSVGVRLSACTRCKEVFYCSKACKLKAWNARHKEECIRVAGQSCSPSPTGSSRRHPASPVLAHMDGVSKHHHQHSAAAETSMDQSRQKSHHSLTLPDKASEKKIPAKDQSEATRAKLYDFPDVKNKQASKPFKTEDGRLVYLDNYSFN